MSRSANPWTTRSCRYERRPSLSALGLRRPRRDGASLPRPSGERLRRHCAPSATTRRPLQSSSRLSRGRRPKASRTAGSTRSWPRATPPSGARRRLVHTRSSPCCCSSKRIPRSPRTLRALYASANSRPRLEGSQRNAPEHQIEREVVEALDGAGEKEGRDERRAGDRPRDDRCHWP